MLSDVDLVVIFTGWTSLSSEWYRSSILPSILKHASPTTLQYIVSFDVGVGGVQKVLMRTQTSPRPCPPAMPLILLGENIEKMFPNSHSSRVAVAHPALRWHLVIVKEA